MERRPSSLSILQEATEFGQQKSVTEWTRYNPEIWSPVWCSPAV